MAQTTTIEYFCDACGLQVSHEDYLFHRVGMEAYYNQSRTHNWMFRTHLCPNCSASLLGWVNQWFGARQEVSQATRDHFERLTVQLVPVIAAEES